MVYLYMSIYILIYARGKEEIKWLERYVQDVVSILFLKQLMEESVQNAVIQ